MSSFSSPLCNSNTSIKSDKGQHLQFLQYFVTWRFPDLPPVRCIDGHCFLFNLSTPQSVLVRPTLLLTTDGQPSEKRLGLISVRPHLGPSYTSYTLVPHIPHIPRSLVYLLQNSSIHWLFLIKHCVENPLLLLNAWSTSVCPQLRSLFYFLTQASHHSCPLSDSEK